MIESLSGPPNRPRRTRQARNLALTLLSLRSISKRFGSTVALDDVSFDVHGGEVHALLGENGAGKTTLMRIAYGLQTPDSGSIRVESEQRTTNSERLVSPRHARSLGIGMVHQHFTSIPAFTVAENIALAAGWRETGRRAVRRAGKVIAELGIPLDPAAPTAELTAQLRQRLEIVQALAAQARILLLDEPTAVLAPREVAELVALIRRFAERGGAVVLITHKLREVASVADRVTVLRGGRVALTGSVRDHDEGSLSRAMMGAESALDAQGRGRRGVGPLTRGETETVRVEVRQSDGAAVRWHAGEIVGIAAIEGNGQRQLLRAIAGVEPVPEQFGVAVHGSVAFIPEDRTLEALMGDFSLTENFALGHADRLPRWLDWRAIKARAQQVITDHDVRAIGPEVDADTLSGGNQQKFVLGRALARQPDIIVAEDPTRGLDIRATEAVYGELRGAADRGACVVLHCSDLDEVLALADRLMVMHGGRLRELPVDASRATVGDAMLGLEAAAK